MRIDAKLVKTLRDKTGAGMMDCKKALVESDGNLENAVDYLRKSGVAKAEKKGVRETKDGLVYSYIHAGGRLGVLVELHCESDFVATNPMAIDRESIPDDVIAREKDIYTEQAKAEGKPDNIIEKMVEGRLNKFYQENCLLEQAYIKDPDKKVKDLLTELIATLGENISIKRFVRFAIGETHSTNGQV